MNFPEQVSKFSLSQFGIKRETIVPDAVSGLTFALVNIPQGMANALLAGVNPVLGLYTLMIATPVAALFTSSVYMNVSTTSALSVAAGDALINVPAGAKTANLIMLVLMVGVVQLLAGLFRMGSLLRFVSRSVMVGFIGGVAALIILGQIGDFTGYDSVFSKKLLQLADLTLNLGQVHWPTLILSSATMLIIIAVGYTRLRKIAMLIGLLASTLLAFVFQPDGIAYVGDIASLPDQLLNFDLPEFLFAPDLLASAVAIAIIGMVQGAGVSQNYPNPDGKYPDISRDFLGQGVSNIATSFFQGIPAGGSMSGTAVTVGAGAQTRWANILAGLLVIPLVWMLNDFIELVPMSALAALLVVVGFQSFNPADVKTIWQTGKVPATAMILTFVSTLTLPIQYAVFIGVAVSVLLHVFRSSNQIRLVKWEPVEGGFPIETEVPAELPSNEITVLFPYGSLFFAAATSAETQLPEVGSARRPVVLLAVRGREEVGSTLIGVLLRYNQSILDAGGRLMLIGVGDHVQAQLERTGAMAEIGEENIFHEEPQIGLAYNEALAVARAWLAEGSDEKAHDGEEDDIDVGA